MDWTCSIHSGAEEFVIKLLTETESRKLVSKWRESIKLGLK
jgi:hypothetical protein